MNAPNISVCMLFLLLVFSVSDSLNYEDRSWNVTKELVDQGTCPFGQWSNGRTCIPCTQRCPRFMYKSSNCSFTQDRQCSNCYYTESYEVSRFGDQVIRTWHPTDTEECSKENIRGINHVSIAVFLVISMLIFAGFALFMYYHRRMGSAGSDTVKQSFV